MLGYIRDHLNFNVLFFHIYGPSSSGKSSSSQLCISSYGRPSIRRNGLILTWNSTINAIAAYLKDKIGFCFILDESSSRSQETTTAMIYFFTEGIEKGRSTIEGDLRQQGEWAGSILSTGESGLIDSASNFEGLRMRLHELSLRQWTLSAENSKNIQRGLQKNYGNSARHFALYLLKLGEETVIERFRECHDFVMSKLPHKDQFSDRIADRYSVVLLTLLLANECLKLEFNPEKVLALLIDAEEESIEDRDIAKKAYRFLLDYITTVPSRYYKWQKDANYKVQHPFNETNISFQTMEGRIDFEGKDAQTIYFQRNTLDHILIENGFQSPSIVIKAMKEKGYLQIDSGGKLQVNRKMYPDAPVRTRVYGIKIQPEDRGIYDTTLASDGQESVTNKRTVVQMKSQRKRHNTNHVNIENLFTDEEGSE
ncbi:MAG TPA: hypothetical protein DEO33_03015 [Rikenellaceae bacterium]|nr:hypothetical protein [Rikenellaceae bacterium]